jgi:hypothetical protein
MKSSRVFQFGTAGTTPTFLADLADKGVLLAAATWQNWETGCTYEILGAQSKSN